jgi:hypothetical protein
VAWAKVTGKAKVREMVAVAARQFDFARELGAVA